VGGIRRLHVFASAPSAVSISQQPYDESLFPENRHWNVLFLSTNRRLYHKISRRGTRLDCAELRPQVRISNVGSVLDPSLRTAKVRIEARNPGLMRVGMFVTATFHGQQKEKHAAVPASAILHLHDRDWVYVPMGEKRFRRVEVVSGEALPNSMQEIVSGIQAETLTCGCHPKLHARWAASSPAISAGRNSRKAILPSWFRPQKNAADGAHTS
jgi:hypothetical protein